VGAAINFLIQIGASVLLARHLTQNPYNEQFYEDLNTMKECNNMAVQQSNSTTPLLNSHFDCFRVRAEMDGVRDDIIGFLGTDEAYPAGWAMSLITSYMWALAVFQEFRQICNFCLSLSKVPRDKSCTILLEDNTLKQISTKRFLVGLLVELTRLGIAVTLLVSGSLMLCYTTEIEDLLLNATALNFVLETDQWMFPMATPFSIKEVMRNMDPLPMPHGVSQKLVGLFLGGSVLYVTIFDFTMLRPYVHEMIDIFEFMQS
jgi:hypothetical protein